MWFQFEIRIKRKALFARGEPSAVRVKAWLATLPEAAHMPQHGGRDLAAVSVVHPGVLHVDLIID